MKERNKGYCCVLRTFLNLFIALFLLAVGIIIGSVLPISGLLVGGIAAAVLLVLIVIFGIIYLCLCRNKGTCDASCEGIFYKNKI